MSVSLVKRPMPQGTLWVCTDCLFAAVNGDEPVDPDSTQPQPWAIENGADATPGILTHDCDDPDAWERGEDCGCDTREFSWTSCDGCGSTLGGSRHAFTYWA